MTRTLMVYYLFKKLSEKEENPEWVVEDEVQE